MDAVKKSEEAVIDFLAKPESVDVILDYMERNRLPHFTISVEIPKEYIEQLKVGNRSTLIRLKYNFRTKEEE